MMADARLCSGRKASRPGKVGRDRRGVVTRAARQREHVALMRRDGSLQELRSVRGRTPTAASPAPASSASRSPRLSRDALRGRFCEAAARPPVARIALVAHVEAELALARDDVARAGFDVELADGGERRRTLSAARDEFRRAAERVGRRSIGVVPA